MSARQGAAGIPKAKGTRKAAEPEGDAHSKTDEKYESGQTNDDLIGAPEASGIQPELQLRTPAFFAVVGPFVVPRSVRFRVGRYGQEWRWPSLPRYVPLRRSYDGKR